MTNKIQRFNFQNHCHVVARLTNAAKAEYIFDFVIRQMNLTVKINFRSL